ncbi:MATE efflux family protein [Euphorbia peplus]|nr:MATE efflux family protein [Euphorbia peplus]
MEEKASSSSSSSSCSVQEKAFGVEMKQENQEKMIQKTWVESKMMWQIAAPAMLTAVTQFSLGFVTSAYVGHLGELELAAVSIVQNVIEGFVYGVMLGMGSALETLCGQAVGAGQINMLGIYMQRSWIITAITSLFLLPVYVFASPILKLLRQDKEISELAGKYAKWIVPQLYAYSINFPIQKFLQAQSKVWVMTIISVVALAFHVVLNWLLVEKLDHGLLGAAIAGNISWCLMVLAHIVYVVSGYFPEAWTGLSFAAFKSLAGFAKLSLASAVMLCLEVWYYTAVILMVGWLPNPEIAVDAISICMNLQLWTLMIAIGFNAAVSVRVSNELGARNPKAAKFSVMVTLITSTILGALFAAIVVATKNEFPKVFTGNEVVMKEASKLAYFLAATIFLSSILPVLHGVAVGAGWQMSVALINIGCYYIIGLPIGAVLGYKFDLGVKGIWTGMLSGSVLQIFILLYIIHRTNWSKEATEARERIRTWGGSPQPQQTSLEHNANE